MDWEQRPTTNQTGTQMKGVFLSDDHVAAVNHAVRQALGEGKDVLVLDPQRITIGEMLRGFYKRSKERKGRWGMDPWGINYATGMEIENSMIFDSVVAAMAVAVKLGHFDQQLVRKVGKLNEIHPEDEAERSYYQKGSPFWVMTEAGEAFYETLVLPPKPASSTKSARRNTGSSPTAVA